MLFAVSIKGFVTDSQTALDAFNEIKIFPGAGPNTPTSINRFPMCTPGLVDSVHPAVNLLSSNMSLISKPKTHGEDNLN